jgi:glycosyltransferase involved in cell wall biosynthesis
MHVALLVPGSLATISGGYAYDRAMVDNLRTLGHSVEVIELFGRFPLGDDDALSAVRRAWDALPAVVVPVIDGLCLPAFTPDMLASRRAVGLIHHPTALEHGVPDDDRLRLRATERELLPRLAGIVVTSDATGERLVAEFGVARERVQVVLPGTADASRSPPHERARCEILSVGTLVPRKGHDVLLRALGRLGDLDWHLTIVGDAGRNPGHALCLATLVEELRLQDHVGMAGEVSASAMEHLWRNADLFALATHHEGYGMAIAEALKRGLPVAVTAGGAAALLVTPETGIVCQAGDVEQFSKALRRLIFDRRLRHDMAEAAWIAGRALPTWHAQAMAFAAAIAS